MLHIFDGVVYCFVAAYKLVSVFDFKTAVKWVKLFYINWAAAIIAIGLKNFFLYYVNGHVNGQHSSFKQ